LIKVRFWDWAATEAKPGKDPDWTVGALLGIVPDTRMVYILDVQRLRGTPAMVEARMVQTAAWDGRDVMIWGEEEPGSAGKFLIAAMTKALRGYAFQGQRSTGDKETFARPFSSYAQAGNVKTLRGRWNAALLDELELFTGFQDGHDDQTDACSKAFAKLTEAYPPVFGLADPRDNYMANLPRGVFPGAERELNYHTFRDHGYDAAVEEANSIGHFMKNIMDMRL